MSDAARMQEYSLGELKRARVWLGTLPKAKGTRVRTLDVVGWPSTHIPNNQVAIEISQEGATYGMLGGSWTADEAGRRRLRVDVGEDRGPPWPDAFGEGSVHLGLPAEYAPGVLRALQGANVNLGSGTLHITHAAHSDVGSNPSFFARIATSVAKLTLLHEHGPDVAVLLEEAFRAPSPPNPIAALQQASREGANLKTLLDVLHQECAEEPYQRGLVMFWFVKTFEIGVRDLQTFASWEGFGGGATVPLEEIESIYRKTPLKLR